MWWILLWVIAAYLLAALVVLLMFEKGAKRPVIALTVGLVVAVGSSLGSYPIALNAVQVDAVGGFHQFENGAVVRIDDPIVTKCDEDGSCVNTEQCDPYQVSVPVTSIDSKGNATITWDEETRYHSCPQATEEYTYTVGITIDGQHVTPLTIASHIFAAQPKQWRDDILLSTSVARGIPPLWRHASDSLREGHADAVTIDSTYVNYTLGQQTEPTNLDTLRQKNLLPLPTAGLDTKADDLKSTIHDSYKADKVSFVGMKPPANAADWQASLMQYNTELGMKAQGDMHIVFVKDTALKGVTTADDYMTAVRDYWMNGLGKFALAKNGIVLIIGVDSDFNKVVWTRASTGMPKGNEDMLAALTSQLPGKQLKPSIIIGAPQLLAKGNSSATVEFQAATNPGVVEQITLHDHPFARVCMNCKDEGKPGYVYLQSEIPISGWGIAIPTIIDILLVIVALAIGLAITIARREEQAYNRNRTYDYHWR